MNVRSRQYPGQPKYAFELRGSELWVKGVTEYANYFQDTKVDFDGTNVSFKTVDHPGTNDETAMVCTGVLGIDRLEGTVEFTMKVPLPLKLPPWPRRQQWVATRVGD